jgi:uncharacterized protein
MAIIMEERIIKFFAKNRILSLATSVNCIPYCCTLFYAFDSDRNNFYFMSSSDTKHILNAKLNPLIAGTIISAEVNIARLQGIQFTGRFSKSEGELFSEAKRIYLKAIPAAHFLGSSLWTIEIDYIKMTDNTLGFGKKHIWSREAEVTI